MCNKTLKEYVNEVNNKETNYKNILSKSEEVSKMKKNKKIVLHIVFVFVGIFLIGALSTQIYAKIQWNIRFKEYQNRDFEYGNGKTMDNEIESGYGESVIDMEYISQKGIKAKVDSILITEDEFIAKINFQFEDDIQVNSESFSFGYAIYDEENNIYDIEPRIQPEKKYDNYTPFFYKELGIDYDEKNLYSEEYRFSDSATFENLSAINRTIVSKIKLTSTRGFPPSKKIYIRVFDLGFLMTNIDYDNSTPKINAQENFSISDVEWIFEINIPEKFYNREKIELKLEEDISGLDIRRIDVSQMLLMIEGSLEGYSDRENFLDNRDFDKFKEKKNEVINITDNDGNIYYSLELDVLNTSANGFKCRFRINRDIFEDKELFLNVKINGQKFVSKLIENKI